jgi:hypothetical protein
MAWTCDTEVIENTARMANRRAVLFIIFLLLELTRSKKTRHTRNTHRIKIVSTRASVKFFGGKIYEKSEVNRFVRFFTR